MLAAVALLIAADPAMSAGKLSWFDDAPFAGVGILDVPEARLRNPSEYTTFGVNLYRAERLTAAEGYPAEAAPPVLDADTLRLYGELESGRDRRLSLEESSLGRINAFGVKWQHHLNAMHSFAVSAEYGEGTAVYPSPLDTLDTRAAFSWTSRLPVTVKPSLTGSVFFGDETAREEISRRLGRKYYGFAVGGSLTLFQSHTPYVSFKMQKSLYDTADEPLFVSPRSDDRSLLSAGWKWQAGRDFSLQAEASYGLGTAPNPEYYNPERSRLFFGTRYDFR